MTRIRILLTGGGTGGHIYPLIAVAQKLRGLDLRYFGDPGPFRSYLEQNDIKVHKITASKFRRYFSLLNFLDFFKFFWSIFQSWWKMFWVMPDLIFSKGGPGALAVILVGRFYRIPLIIHESDVIPGLTAKISARYAKKIKLAFAEAQDYFKEVKTEAEISVVGQPIREELLLLPGDPAEAKRSFGFNPALPVVLILGGSQGAASLNNFILNNLEDLTAKFQILHSVGLLNYTEYKSQYDFISKDLSPLFLKNYRFVPLFSVPGGENNLKDAYDAADLVVSRAGASAIFEIAARGKPAVLIPFPISANGHQEQNAIVYEKAGGAIIIREENLLKNIFINEILKILTTPDRTAKMSEAAKQFYKADAAQKIADDIVKLVI